MFLKRRNIWTILLLWMCFSACGYSFRGSGNFPSGIKSICITVLENRTSETGMENIVTDALNYEIFRSKKVVSTGKRKADAILSGVINSMSVETISHKGVHTSLERRVKVSVDLKLTDQAGRVIWSAKGVSASKAYDVKQSDKLATEQNRRNAISALSKKIAEKVYNSLTEDF